MSTLYLRILISTIVVIFLGLPLIFFGLSWLLEDRFEALVVTLLFGVFLQLLDMKFIALNLIKHSLSREKIDKL